MRTYYRLPAARRTVPGHKRRLGLLLLVPLLLNGCDSEPPQAEEPPAKSGDDRLAEPVTGWLGKRDKLTPEQWIARHQGEGGGARSVESIRAALQTASRKFGETPRMVANRAVQLEKMLAERGTAESAADLIEELTRRAPERNSTQGFGALCQQYFQLRTAGMTREQALAALQQ